jgi:hypothetical protein
MHLPCPTDLPDHVTHKPVFLELSERVGCDRVTGEPLPLQRVTINPSSGGVVTLVGSCPVSPADSVDAETLLDLRARLLRAGSVRARIAKLAEIVNDGQALRSGATSLSDDLDGHLTCREIGRAARYLADHGRPPLPSLVARTGSERARARKRADETLRLVAESLAMRAAGASATEADEAVAEPVYRWRADIAAFRMRLRTVAKRLRPE